MAVLKGFPIVSQLTEITSDGRPSENKVQDCVAASFGAAILYYQGKTQWDHEINPDRLKDAAYGEAWRNDGTAAFKYIPFCQSLGYKLYAINGNPGQLVQHIHEQLAAGRPVVFTEPDPYVSSALGWSHVCVFYADKPGELTSMDPYIAKSITKSDQEWLNLLLFNQIWIVERMEDFMPIDIHSPGVAAEFEETDAHHWRSKRTAKIIQYGMLAEFKQRGYSAGWGHPMSNEIYYAPDKSKQHWENCVTGWEKATNKVSLLPLYTGGPGTDPELVKLLASPPVADTSALQAQLDATTTALAQSNKQVVTLQQKIQVAEDALRA